MLTLKIKINFNLYFNGLTKNLESDISIFYRRGNLIV